LRLTSPGHRGYGGNEQELGAQQANERQSRSSLACEPRVVALRVEANIQATFTDWLGFQGWVTIRNEFAMKHVE